MKQKPFLPILLGAAILSFLYWIINSLLGIQNYFEHYLFTLLSNLLVCLVIFLLIASSVLPRKSLVLYLFVVYFIIGHFNILIEAYIFDVTDREQTLVEILRGLLVSLLFSPIAVFIYEKGSVYRPLKFKKRSLFSWAWRIGLTNFIYLVFYSVAGLILVNVYPQLLDFYEGKIPPLDVALMTQVFLRAPVFILIGLLILRTTNLPKVQRACLVGIVFSVFGGIAPLIPANDLMPGFVRFGHLFEVGISNFLFGFILSYLIGQKIMEMDDTTMSSHIDGSEVTKVG